MRETAPAPPAPVGALEKLRHVAPADVAELLGLKEPYVHELCRTGKLPATKKGKYWIIPVAGLREWVAYPRPGVDRSGQAAGDSLDQPARPGPPLRLRRADERQR